MWLTQDVYRGQIEQPLTLHRTLYVLANPVNNVDAYGYAVIANGTGGSGGGSTPVSPQQPTPPNPARPDSHPYEWKHERNEARFESSGGGRDEPEDERGYFSYLIHRRGRLERGPDASSVVAANSTLTAEDEPWWVQIVTDPEWQQVFLDSATRHNRAETELTDEEFAAALAAIVCMESGTVGGAAVGESVEDRFKRWVNSQLTDLSENERYQVVVFSKTAEIEWNYAYGHEGLMHQVLTVGGSLFGMEGARKGYALGSWISSHLPLTGQSEGLPNIHPETIRQLREGIAPLDVPTAEQIERLRAEGRLVEQEGRYYLRTGVEVHRYGEDSPVAGEAFPAAQGWTTLPGFIMGGHSERIRQDQYIEYLAANLEAGLLVAQAQEVELSGTSGPLPVTWAPGVEVEVPRSVQVMAGWAKVGIVRQPEQPPNLTDLPQADRHWWTEVRPEAEAEAYERYAGGIGALYLQMLPYLQP